MEWEINISSAFLQGNQPKRTVYVRPPAEICEEGKSWQLKRCFYGLSNAPREWYDRVCEEMGSNLEGLITIHVDDFKYCGMSFWHKNVINNLYRMFKISKKEKDLLSMLDKMVMKYSLNIEQNGDEIFIEY